MVPRTPCKKQVIESHGNEILPLSQNLFKSREPSAKAQLFPWLNSQANVAHAARGDTYPLPERRITHAQVSGLRLAIPPSRLFSKEPTLDPPRGE
ncbi:hypothetical protein ECG_05824 [Echinococcus granulosus]|nr:hypothetical protein ECG_05824 [Echinococcus granulosus]